MRAIHWIRSRQESREISYWLSFVFFDAKDRSLNNRIYLVYLVAFFSIWWFMVLIWFAKAGAFLLTTFSPSQPMAFVVSLELAVLLIWFIVSFIQSLRRSPVSFSEEDAYLVCQMPLNPRKAVLRWLAMPWVKSLIPFLVFALILGFSLAETNLAPGERTGHSLLEYARVGLRALLVIVPIHLTLFTLNGSVGIWLMKHQRKMKALFLPVTSFLIITLVFLSGIIASFTGELPMPLQTLSTVMTTSLQVGFSSGDMGMPLLLGWLAAAFLIFVLVTVSTNFSLSLAAQETAMQSKIKDLQRYGFSSQANDIRTQKRLGIERKATWFPAWCGAKAMFWKDILQYFRTFDSSTAFNFVYFISIMTGLVFIPNLSGRIFLILTWTLQAGKFLTERLHQDLTHWTIIKQLPIKSQKWILYDLLFASCVLLLMSLVGLTAGSVLSHKVVLREALALPGMIATVAGISAGDIFRNSRINLLINGRAPGVSEIGVIMGTICAGIPVVIFSVVPGLAGMLIAFLASLCIGGYAISAAINAYRVIL